MATTKLRLTDLEALGQAAECLKTLAHPHRLRMVQMLLQGDYTVGELAEACELPSAMASEHLRLMQRCGFLSVEKEGRSSFYSIGECTLSEIMGCIDFLKSSGVFDRSKNFCSRLMGDAGPVFATLEQAFCRFGPPEGHVTIDLTVSANSPSTA